VANLLASSCALTFWICAASFSAGHIDVVIRVYDEAGNLIETHEQAGDFKEW
jgi:hypothetical protein